MTKHQYPDSGTNATCFRQYDSGVRLDRLFGLNCGLSATNEGLARAQGLLSLSIGSRTVNPDELKLVEASFDEDNAEIVWQTAADALSIRSDWRYCRQTDIWSRSDTLTNNGSREISIRRCLAKFAFSPGRYEIYSQGSYWCNENQGNWRTLDHGGLVLGCEGGRTTQGGTPYLCIRESGSGAAVVFHIVPRGNWVIRVNAETAGGDMPPFAVVELGLSDKHLSLNLLPGESLRLPQILIQAAPEGAPHQSAPYLHEFLLQHQFNEKKESTPIVYNTWFDDFEFLNVPRLRKQLAAVREIGCEIFVVDAGWYGGAAGSWSEQTGDWREKEDAAFEGRMTDFAEEVRAAGLGFGLWMEPERLCESVPIRLAHSEWFLPGANGQFYPDLSRDEVSRYIFSEMSRLVETYRLAWMKVDFNFELGVDPKGSEFSAYYEKWYGILDELRAQYPEVFFEGCASGGMRLDANTVSHFDGHFLSDNVNPWDVLRINQEALLRLPPGRFTQWTVLRTAGNTIPRYGTPVDRGETRLVTPAGCGAIWDSSETVDLDFAARAALPGIFGLSGDIAGLPAEARARLRYHVDFHKKWRRFIAGAVAHLLTPPRPMGDRSGWVGMQLRNPRQEGSLVFIYRLEDTIDRKNFHLRGLVEERRYRIEDIDDPDGEHRVECGADLMNGGLKIEMPAINTASVFVISAQ
jgi:alpha-galactosidase